ncbi:Glyoxysomal fatty acid beta-oxidation multifunctional protein MFP-a [Morella rubra]|uniref:Glyoxysomal fatty acid beta-oxidation multifunctional protein MFP-a n=1 Tax=Morella rubra TaxID=262757 RepID=A0A6A1VQS2_9ROSI|nr:Glyoxysomal fatty acid beta-oxidation multifunctional protein MFP-a [Morella rubra]
MGTVAKGRTVMEVGADGVALITIINPPVNSLSFDEKKEKTRIGGDPRSFPGGGTVEAPPPAHSGRPAEGGGLPPPPRRCSGAAGGGPPAAPEPGVEEGVLLLRWPPSSGRPEWAGGGASTVGKGSGVSPDPMLRNLKDNYDEALARDDVKAIVVTGVKGRFSGGFDISALGRPQSGPIERIQKPGYISVELITGTLEAARKPSVAAIDGLALGGGLEVAMACHARISTPTAQLRLPELQLGIIPGFGGAGRLFSHDLVVGRLELRTDDGTQRLPRLVGLSKALEMILMSKPIKGEEAYTLGLVDAIISPDDLVNTARQWALDILDRRRPWVSTLYKTDKIEPLREAREILKFARAQAQNQSPNVKHPLVCIDVIEEGILSGPWAGLLKEAAASTALKHSDTSKSLVHIFFAQRGTSKFEECFKGRCVVLVFHRALAAELEGLVNSSVRKFGAMLGSEMLVPGVTDIGLVPRRVTKVGVLGGGLMGSGIATSLILSGYPVILKEVNDKFLQAGLARVRANLQSRVKKGKMAHEECEKTISLLKGVLNYESFKDVDMVIEAVIEKVSLKQQIFSDLEKYCPPHCILGSNTSTIDLNLIGERTKSQDRIVGAHFFSPAHVMPLLEIVRTKQTSSQVIVDLLDVGKKIKKTPVVVGNCTGFAVNRIFFPYRQAANLLVEHGTDLYQIDRAITKFGMPMGPFRLADLVGFGVAIATGKQYVLNFPERTYNSMLLSLLQEDKRSGETTHKGFYIYDEKRTASPDPEIKKFIEKSRSISGVTVDPELVKLPEKDIVEMIFFPVVNEACRVLAERIAVKAADLDVASVMGMGFPSYRGGIMFWADSLGSRYIYSRLGEWSKMYGEFFKPCDYLAERAAKGVPLSLPVEHGKSQL